MKLAKNIKRCVGVAYAFAFSFALCGGILNFKKKALETRASFTGTFTVTDNDLDYSPQESYIFKSITMTGLTDNGSGNYTLDLDIYGMAPTGGDSSIQESGSLFFTQATWYSESGTGEYGNYVGNLSGFCNDIDGGNNSVTIRTYISPTGTTSLDGWSFAEGNLYYSTDEYEVDSAQQTGAANYGDGEIEVYYVIWGRELGSQGSWIEMESLTVHFTGARILDEPDPDEQMTGTISGYCVEYGEDITLIINSIVNRSHQDGWTYLSVDKTLAYYDSNYPDANYKFSSAYFTQYNCQAVIVYVGKVTGASDPQTAQIWDAVYDYNAAIISGTLAVMDAQTSQFVSTQTEVELEFEEPGVVDEYYTEGWNYSQTIGEFIYYYEDQTYDSLDVVSSVFNIMRDKANSYAVISYSVTPEGLDNPITQSFTISEAKYDDLGQTYGITGKTTLIYKQVEYTFPVDFVISRLSIEHETGFHFDSGNHIFTYYWGDYGQCRTVLKSVIFNNFGTLTGGEQSQQNEIYLVYDVYNPQEGHESETIRNNEEIHLTNARITSMPGQETNDGYLVGSYEYESDPITVAFNASVVENTIVNGFNYLTLNQRNAIIYYVKNTDQRYSVTPTQAEFDVYYNEFTVTATCSNGNEQENITDTFTLTSGTIESEQEGTIKGKFQNTDTEVTLTVSSITRVNTLPLGWNYENSILGYYDPQYKTTIPHEFSSAVYNEDYDQISITYTVKYSIVVQDERDSTSTILIKSPTITPNRAGGYSSYSVEGYCVEVDTTVRVVISSYDSVKSGWEYDESDGLFYYDSLLDTYVPHEFSSASYFVDNKEMLIDYTLKYSEVDQSSYDRSETITIKNPQITEQSAGTYAFYKVVGFCVEVNRDIELEIESYDELKASWEYSHPRELYAELIWNDPVTESMSMLTEANYNQDLGTVNFVYGIYTYEYDETAGQDQGGDVVEVLKMEKVIHFENVSVTFVDPAEEPDIAEYTDEPIYNVVGTNLDVAEATLLSCPQSKFNYIEYDPEAGTITNDQQIDIKELLPEEKSVDEERMEDSIVAISSETAHEIIVTVNNAHSEIEDAKTAGTITEDEYLEKKQIIETVTEASVVVGAGQTTASDEGKAVDNALPDDHDLGFTMDETLSEFYQLQMDYLLGREAIPEKQDPNKGALRLGDPLAVQGKIDLDISKDDYAKMIGFVDTSVSNMKGAALQIRKCSSVSMKAVVKSYISKVKISSFRDFNEEDANNKFVEAVSEAIMLNMQQQVIEALKRDHKPSNNAEKEMVYQQQLAACEDIETFKEIVLEVLRQKYVSLTKTEIAIDDFRPIYANIFRSWALDDPALNESGITLEQLTKATIETTKANANKFTYRESVTPQESTFLIVFGAAIAVGVGAAIATPVIFSKTKHRRRAK